MLEKNKLNLKHKRFKAANIGAILLSANLCFLLGQSQAINADLIAPAAQENTQQAGIQKENKCPDLNHNLEQNQASVSAKPNIPNNQKDFVNQIHNSDQGVGVPAPGSNYHLNSLPTTPTFTDGKVNNPDNPTLSGKAPSLGQEPPENGNISAANSSEAHKIKSNVSKQKVATESAKAKIARRSKQSTNNKTQKVHYANIFAPKEITNKTKKNDKGEQKKIGSSFSADVINRKGQKVGYIDRHDRVHLEKLSYTSEIDKPSFALGLVSVLAAGLVALVGLINTKKKI